MALNRFQRCDSFDEDEEDEIESLSFSQRAKSSRDQSYGVRDFTKVFMEGGDVEGAGLLSFIFFVPVLRRISSPDSWIGVVSARRILLGLLGLLTR